MPHFAMLTLSGPLWTLNETQETWTYNMPSSRMDLKWHDVLSMETFSFTSNHWSQFNILATIHAHTHPEH